MNTTSTTTYRAAILSVMLCFFAMGFVDLVGIASNYVKSDLQLSDSVANIFPSLVFFWFLLFSVPTGMLMNKIGRKNTVLLSLVVTAVSLLLPLFGESFAIMLTAFSLLGIGNAIMQTSLNPLLTTVMGGGSLASTLTFGQFIKAIASFLAPYLAMWGATAAIPTFGYNWRIPNIVGRRAVRHVVFDTNFWKSFVASRFLTSLGDKGCLSLWGRNPETHMLFSEHMTAEYRVKTEGRGRRVEEWKMRPEAKDNHWWDGIVGNAVAASMVGCVLAGTDQAVKKVAKPKVRLSDLRRIKNS